jgi:hypothetical protein
MSFTPPSGRMANPCKAGRKGHVHTNNITFSKHNKESKTFKKPNKIF